MLRRFTCCCRKALWGHITSSWEPEPQIFCLRGYILCSVFLTFQVQLFVVHSRWLYLKHVLLACVCVWFFRWCGPCKILGPRLEKAIAKQKGRVAMAKVDIDDHTDLAIEYGVRTENLLLYLPLRCLRCFMFRRVVWHIGSLQYFLVKIISHESEMLLRISEI